MTLAATAALTAAVVLIRRSRDYTEVADRFEREAMVAAYNQQAAIDPYTRAGVAPPESAQARAARFQAAAEEAWTKSRRYSDAASHPWR